MKSFNHFLEDTIKESEDWGSKSHPFSNTEHSHYKTMMKQHGYEHIKTSDSDGISKHTLKHKTTAHQIEYYSH